MWYCVFLVIFGIPVYYVLYHAAVARNIGIAVVGNDGGNAQACLGIVPAYLSERFPTKRRAVGVGFGYSAGALIGAWFSLYVWWAHNIPFIKVDRRAGHVALPRGDIDRRRDHHLCQSPL